MSTPPLAFDRVVAIGVELPGTQAALPHAAALADGLGVGLTALAVDQDHFPPEVGDQALYHPTAQGAEAEVARRLAEIDRVARRRRDR